MIPRLAAGDMDQRITIQQQASTTNALGEIVGGWSTVATVWARAEPLRGREYFAAGQMQQTLDVRFRLRYRADITASMRVIWKGVPHDIVGVPIDVEGGGHTLELMCTAEVRDGR